MAMHVIKYASKGISAGIGVASEAVVEVKHRRSSQDDYRRGSQDDPNDLNRSPTLTKSVPAEIEEESLDDDEAEWRLDDMVEKLEPVTTGKTSSDTSLPRELFLKRIERMTVPTERQPLPRPVILPQRRPKTHTRGFIRAYAPVLEECAGVDQTLFLDFLDDFDRSSRASPVFDVINLAALGVGIIPTPFTGLTMGVSIAVQFASNTGKELQTRVRRNNYLDEINQKFFMPRGLCCVIMTYRPDDPLTPVIRMDESGMKEEEAGTVPLAAAQSDTTLALSKSLSPIESGTRARFKKLRLSSGQTEGEMSLPESAPLVYPAIDMAAATAMDGNEAARQSFFQSSSSFLNSYLDRRAQARWQGQHPSSRLASLNPPSEKKFANRFADPNHPVHSGTIIGLVTGGKVDPVADLRAKHAQWRARRKGVELSEEEVWNARMGRKTAKGRIGRALQQNVLYMIITNLPSEEEMQAAIAQAKELKA